MSDEGIIIENLTDSFLIYVKTGDLFIDLLAVIGYIVSIIVSTDIANEHKLHWKYNE